MKTNAKILGIAQMGMFSALILLLAFIPGLGYIPLGVTRATTLHIPVIIGSLLLGPRKGATLGALFGMTSLVTNTVTPTITSFVFTPFYTLGDTSGNFLSLVICFVPRILCGVVPYYVYKLLKSDRLGGEKGQSAKLAVAGFAGSMTNTLLVMNMIYLFFGTGYAVAKELGIEALYGVILGVIGMNGVPEAIVAAVLVAAVTKTLMHLRFSGAPANAHAA